MKTIIVTGGAGFIGSNFVHYVLEQTSDTTIINLDALTYAGNLENLTSLKDDPRHVFVRGDINNRELVDYLIQKYQVESIIHFAAESHVDRSIMGAQAFVQTNVMGTLCLLEAVKRFQLKRFVHISTDEVYGSLQMTEPAFTESHPIQPNNPYSASKASADLLVLSYIHTFGLPAVITRCSNNYGPFQFPEKLIPLMISNALSDKSLPVYGTGKNVRDWIYVKDHCRAIWNVYNNGKLGEVYNIGSDSEMANIDIVKLLLKKLHKSESLIQFVQDRLGHDLRYAMNATKIQTQLHWKPETSFDQGIEMTIEWYLTHKEWLSNVLSGQYMEYYQQQYGHR